MASKGKSTETVAGGCLAVILLVAAAAAVNGWALMILLGIIHHYAPSVPALGFYVSAGVAVVLSLVTGMFRRAS